MTHALLRALHRNPEAYVDLRAISDDRPTRASSVPVRNLEAGVDAFVSEYPDANIFFGVAQRRQGGQDLADCTELHSLFTDQDFKTTPEATVRGLLAEFPLQPSAIVTSGGGLHCYWFLTTAFDLHKGEAPEAKRFLRALASRLKADPRAAEPARILRIPGTRNFKYQPPPVAQVELLDIERRYTLDQLTEVLPLEEHAQPAAQNAAPLPEQVGPGGRNNTLLAEGGRLRRMGWGEEEIFRALLGINDARCRPPLDGREVRAIARSVARYSPAEDTFPTTQTGNAEFFALAAANHFRYDHGRRAWYEFTGQHWTADRMARVDQVALEAIRGRQAAALRIPEADLRKKRLRWAVDSESRAGRENLTALAAKLPALAVSGDGWDTDPWSLGVANGVIDLRTGLLRDGKPEDLITKVAPVTFDPSARCPRWERFLTEVFGDYPEVPAYLQRILGYALTGITSEQVFWIFYGEGANGKSTLVEVFMHHVLGDAYAWVMPFPAADWTNAMSEYQKASLVGQRFITASEVTRRGYLNEELIKSLTGGDAINARHPYGRPFKFIPAAKIFLRVNHKPVIRDQSHGMWRRVKLIPFTRTFAVNPALSDELRAEAPGILAWAVRGCLDWQREGLVHPTTVEAATADYRAESNPLTEFFEERCVLAPDVRVRAHELFEDYRRWCAERQIPDADRLSQRALGKQIASDKRFRVEEGRGRQDRGVHYLGIGLLLPAERGAAF